MLQNDPNKEENLENEAIETSDEEVDEVVYDDEELPGDQVKKLRDKLKVCVEEKQEYLDGWQRSKAETINMRKRFEEEKKEFVKYANEGLIHELLPVLDSFDMAFKDKEAWEQAPPNWRKGIEYIYAQILSALESSGVKKDNPLGANFDSNLHEPLETIETDKEDEDGKIIDVVMPGYKIHDKIVRAAKVKVGRFTK